MNYFFTVLARSEVTSICKENALDTFIVSFQCTSIASQRFVCGIYDFCIFAFDFDDHGGSSISHFFRRKFSDYRQQTAMLVVCCHIISYISIAKDIGLVTQNTFPGRCVNGYIDSSGMI